MSTQEVQEVRAAAKWLRITPRKARLVVDLFFKGVILSDCTGSCHGWPRIDRAIPAI